MDVADVGHNELCALGYCRYGHQATYSSAQILRWASATTDDTYTHRLCKKSAVLDFRTSLSYVSTDAHPDVAHV